MRSRRVRCVQERAIDELTVLPPELCFETMPPAQEICNNHDCPPYWATGHWSECTRTCGYGIQTRRVTCRQVKKLGEVKFLNASYCPTDKPPSVQECFRQHCVEKTSYFTTTPATYIQEGRKQKVVLKAKDHALLLEGTNVKLRCPIRKKLRKGKKVVWEKNGIYVQQLSHVRISKNGALRIKSATRHDNGIYTCIVGRKKHNITLNFRTIDISPDGKITNVTYTTKTVLTNGTDFESILPTVHNERIDFTETNYIPEDKESYMRYLNHTVNEKVLQALSQRRLGEGETYPLGHDMGTTAPYSGGQVDENAIDVYHLNNNNEDGNQNSDSNDFDINYNELDPLEKEISLLAKTDKDTGSRHHDDDDDGGRLSHLIPNIHNIKNFGKGSAEDVTFHWLTFEWTHCSETCGGNGTQARIVYCEMEVNGIKDQVDDSFCKEAGLPKPPVVRKCGELECPAWSIGEWSECLAKTCYDQHTAKQTRAVLCRLPNSTVLPSSNCNPVTVPASSRPCLNSKCEAVWRTEEWTKCMGQCGSKGIQSRILKCVWYGTKEPAGDRCTGPRPSFQRVCDVPPCVEKSHFCYDHSRYCDIVKRLKMCDMSTYKIRCCKTCLYTPI